MTDYKCTIKFTVNGSVNVGRVVDICKEIIKNIDDTHLADNIRWEVE